MLPDHDVVTIAMRFHNMTMGLDWTLDTGEWTNYCNAKLSTPNQITHAVTRNSNLISNNVRLSVRQSVINM